MRRSASVVGLICLGASLLAPRPGRADEASAAETFRAGKAAFSRGEYRAAALSFEAAHREQPHGAAIYNAGQSWLAAGALPRAADAYAEALRVGGLDAAQEADARSRLATLEASLATVTVTAPPGALISLGHVERATPPVVVHVTAGDHTVRADLASGRSVTRAVHAAAGARDTVVIDDPAPVATVSPGASPAPSMDRPPAAGPSGAHVLGWSSLGGAAVAGGAAIFLGIGALDARDAFNASGHTDRAARDRASELQAWTNVAWVAAGALSALGVAILVTSYRAPRIKATWHLTPGGVGVTGHF